MIDYIKREDVLRLVEPDARPFLAERICNLPSADVVERRVGRWEKRMNIDALTWCSECGWMKHQGDDRRYNYCPNCGADMRGEK